MESVAVFIDGFNLYHGLVDAGLRPWLWLDLWKLATKLVGSSRQVSELNYYTATVRRTDGSRERQAAFIDAHTTLYPTTNVVRGFMQADDRSCSSCKMQPDYERASRIAGGPEFVEAWKARWGRGLQGIPPSAGHGHLPVPTTT